MSDSESQVKVVEKKEEKVNGEKVEKIEKEAKEEKEEKTETIKSSKLEEKSPAEEEKGTKEEEGVKKPSYKALSDELATIGSDFKKTYSSKDIDSDEKPSSISGMSRLMNKKLTLDSDGIGSTSTRLSSSVKIDEDDLDKEIAARMQAFSFKPSSSLSYLSDPVGGGSSFSSKTYSSKDPASSSFSSSSYYPSGSGAYMSDSGSTGVKNILESRIKDLESDLENERLTRSKSEKQKADFQKDLGSMKDKLEESQQNLSKQVELNRRREHQLQNISRLLEESQTQAESNMAAFKKKHQETVGELMDQVDDLHKSKQKSEKDKLQAQVELEGLKSKAEENKNARSQLEKQVKGLEEQMKEMRMTIIGLEKELGEIQMQKSRYQGDAGDLKKKHADVEKNLLDLTLTYETARNDNKDLENQLREKEEQHLHSQEEVKALKDEVAGLKEEAEDNKERQTELQKRLNKAIADVTTWQQKCHNNESMVHPDDVEEMKKKFVQKLQESEAKVDATIGKMVALEKARQQIQDQSHGFREEIEKLQNELSLNEKKHKQHEKVVDDWKKKVEDLQSQVEEATGEARTGSERTLKVHQQLEDANEMIERLRRENKNLHVDIDDLTQQLEYANQRTGDVDKAVKKAEAEKQELNESINDKELALQKETAKLQRLQMELGTGKEELERKMADKDEEIDSLRKSHAQSLANLTLSLEAESKAKLEALKTTKELEQAISDLHLDIATLNKAKSENDKMHKKYQMQLADLQALFEDEEQMRKKAEDELVAYQQKCDSLKDEIDVLKLQVDSLDRNRKMLEGEVRDGTAKINELNNTCGGLSEAKKKLENTFQICKSDNEDQQMTVKRLEEALKKSAMDINNLNDEVRREQGKAAESDKLRKIYEMQVKELGSRLESSEQLSVAGGKAAWSRLEQRVGELEAELEAERGKTLEREKSQRKQERKIQEMEIHLDEQHNMQLKLGELCEKMQAKIRSYKKYLDEAEQVSEMNLAKYRKMQSDLEEAEARAAVAEKLIEQLRSRAVASVTGGEEVEISRPKKAVKIEE